MRSSDALLVGVGVVGAIASGCFSPLDHTGRQCPCATGFTCETASNTCVADGADTGLTDIDGGDRDAAIDAMVMDAPMIEIDAAMVDAPGLDAGPIDAASPDAWAPDAWTGDARAFDAWTVDAWAGDAWAGDAWANDAWAADAWANDARLVDAFVPSTPDAGFDPCPTGTWLCDDFESAVTTRVPPWGYSDGAPSRTTVLPFRGSASGRFEGLSEDDTQSVGKTLPMVAPAEIWMRAWVLVRPRASSGDQRDGAMLHVGDDAPPNYDNVSVVLSDETPTSRITVGTYNSSTGTFNAGSTIPDDTWTCVAVHVLQGDPGLIELYVGPSRVIMSSDRVMFAGGGFRVIDAGLTYFDSTSDRMTIYLDDVAIGITGTPLRCGS